MPTEIKRLCRAARQGDVAEVERLLEERPQTLDERNRDGRTALIVAVRHSQAGVVAALLRRGADVNGASHRSGATPVWHCAWKGDEPVLALLLAAGADPGTEATDCGTPLMVASQYGHAACVRRLLEHRTPGGLPFVAVDHAQANYKCTALWWACRSDREEVVRLLLARGADFTLTDWKGRTPLDIARGKKHAGCAAALEEALRALLLHKARLVHDAQQCVALLPCARTRRGTHEAQTARLPPCIRARQLHNQQVLQGSAAPPGSAVAVAAPPQPWPLPRVEVVAPGTGAVEQPPRPPRQHHRRPPHQPQQQQDNPQQPPEASQRPRTRLLAAAASPLRAQAPTVTPLVSAVTGSRKRPRPTAGAEAEAKEQEAPPSTPSFSVSGAPSIMTRRRAALLAARQARVGAGAEVGGGAALCEGTEKSEGEEAVGGANGSVPLSFVEAYVPSAPTEAEDEATGDEQQSQGTGHVHHHHHHHHHHHRKKKAKAAASAEAAGAAVAPAVVTPVGVGAAGSACNVEGTVAVARFVLDDLPEQLFVELMDLMG